MSTGFLEQPGRTQGGPNRSSEGIVARGANKERLESQLNGELTHFGVYSKTYSALCGKVTEGGKGDRFLRARETQR